MARQMIRVWWSIMENCDTAHHPHGDHFPASAASLDEVTGWQSATGGVDTRAQLRKGEEAEYLLPLYFYILIYRFCLIQCTSSSSQASPSVILTVAA